MIRHRLAGGEYNRRRGECEEALRLLRDAVPDLGALRDVSLELLRSQRQRMPQAVYRRALHVVSENQRVLEAAAALDRRDLATFGRLLGESHRSLRDDFEVSCDELDLMVHLAAGVEGVFGARMTGGGFGGCTVNLVRTDCVDSFGRLITDGYRRATSLTPEIYVCRAADGDERALGLALGGGAPLLDRLVTSLPDDSTDLRRQAQQGKLSRRAKALQRRLALTDTTGAVRDTAGGLRSILSLPRDSSARLAHFTPLRQDRPYAELTPTAWYPMYSAPRSP